MATGGCPIAADLRSIPGTDTGVLHRDSDCHSQECIVPRAWISDSTKAINLYNRTNDLQRSLGARRFEPIQVDDTLRALHGALDYTAKRASAWCLTNTE